MRIFIITLLSLWSAAAAVDDAFIRQLQPRDSVLIADQLRYGVLLEGIEEGSELGLPQVKDTLMRDVLIVDNWSLDTLKTDKKLGTRDIEAALTITSFEQAEYLLPGIPVLVRRPDKSLDTLYFKGQDVLFCTMPVDTATFKLHDIKAQVKYPVTFLEVLPWIGLALLVAAIVALIWWLVSRAKARKKEAEHKDPAHVIALRKLDTFRSDKYWAASKQKAFYSGVTDVLREYISARYGIGAMEMTTAEIFNALKKSDIPEDLKSSLRELFERSDYVKFAKYVASDEENAQLVPMAVRFVTTTYQEEIEGEAKNVQQ